jgi:hypothetical protein
MVHDPTSPMKTFKPLQDGGFDVVCEERGPRGCIRQKPGSMSVIVVGSAGQ